MARSRYADRKITVMKAITTYVIIAAVLFSCNGNETGTSISDPELKSRGAEITAAVGKTLVGTVQKHMATGGVSEAIQFCQLNALPITDSLSKVHSVQIKRTAIKTRNQNNLPDSLESIFLNQYLASGKYDSHLVSTKTGVAYFEPILLKGFCQTCHGTPGAEMTFETDSIIKSIYPLDEATGFAEGELRGMWALYFNN